MDSYREEGPACVSLLRLHFYLGISVCVFDLVNNLEGDLGGDLLTG